MKKINLLSLILGLIGGLMLSFSGVLIFIGSETYRRALANFGFTFEDAHIDPSLFMISFIITLIWGISSIFLSIVGYILKGRGKRIFKLIFVILVIVGIIAIVGNFLNIKPLEYVDLGGGYFLWVPPIKLSGTFFLIDPILIIIAGILGVVIKP